MEIELANANVITKTAGVAYGINITDKWWIIFFTLAFKTSQARGAGSAVFGLKAPGATYGNRLTIEEPYDYMCRFASDGLYRFSTRLSGDNTYFSNGVSWAVDTEFRITGTGLFHDAN